MKFFNANTCKHNFHQDARFTLKKKITKPAAME